MTAELRLSELPKTWLLDVDGVIFHHNGYRDSLSFPETPLHGAVEFVRSLPPGDRIVLLTSRDSSLRELTESSLRQGGIRFDHLVMGLPPGERILVNDMKPSGLVTAVAVNLERNQGLGSLRLKIDPAL